MRQEAIGAARNACGSPSMGSDKGAERSMYSNLKNYIQSWLRLLPLLLLVPLQTSCRSHGPSMVKSGAFRPVYPTCFIFEPIPSPIPAAPAVAQQSNSSAAISFKDGQSVQMVAAVRNGISPQDNDSKLAQLARKGQLVQIGSCSLYQVDKLTHSYPYLVPKAARLVDDIGRRVQMRVGTQCRIIVTSVLRTRATVARLQKTNRNAVPNSCHMYGTTIDISYSRFIHPASVTDAQVHAALRQALFELRNEGQCYVIQEYGQTCYHLTVR